MADSTWLAPRMPITTSCSPTTRPYVECQERVDALYAQPDEWARRAVLNVAGMGRFSSDRTVLEYAEKVWDVNPVRVPC